MRDHRHARQLADFELQKQIAERQRIERELRQSEARLRALVEHIPAIVYAAVLDEPGGLIYVSPQTKTILGYTPQEWMADPQFWQKHLHPADRSRCLAEQAGMRETGQPATGEYRLIAADGRTVWVHDQAWITRDPQGHQTLLQGVALDITDRVLAEQALRESESKYRSIVENTHDVIMVTRSDGTILYMSPAVRKVLGYEPDELVGKRPRIVHPDDVDCIRQIHDASLQGMGGSNIQYRALTKTGQVRWVNHSWSFIRDTPDHMVVSVLRDITDSKTAQARIELHETQLRELASELILAEERERRRIAMDLHDDLGQKLAIAKIRLTMLSRAAAGTDQEALLLQLCQLIDEAMKSSRSLTFQICPPILYDLGLLPAIEGLAEDMLQRYGLHVTITGDRQTLPLDERVRAALFRCVRELLINVAKHAGVSEARVDIHRQTGAIVIVVADQGSGFDATSPATGPSRRGFGLFSIEERLGYLGGQVHIQSAPGQGTVVTLQVPTELMKPLTREERP